MHLKQFGEILNRVYIRFEDGQYPLPTNKDFSILLKSLAKFHPYADGVHLYEKDSLTGQEHIYLKRTKRFLLKKTAQYILGISQRQADESISPYELESILALLHLIINEAKKVETTDALFQKDYAEIEQILGQIQNIFQNKP